MTLSCEELVEKIEGATKNVVAIARTIQLLRDSKASSSTFNKEIEVLQKELEYWGGKNGVVIDGLKLLSTCR